MADRRICPTLTYGVTSAAATSQGLAIEDERPESHNPRKRSFATEDQSLPDIITRPPKKPRIQDTNVDPDPDPDQTFVHSVAAATNQEKQDDQDQHHFNLATQPLMSYLSIPPIKISRKLPKDILRVRFAPHCDFLWRHPALKPRKPSKSQILEIMTHQPEQNIQFDSNQDKPAPLDHSPTKPISKTHVASFALTDY